MAKKVMDNDEFGALIRALNTNTEWTLKGIKNIIDIWSKEREENKGDKRQEEMIDRICLNQIKDKIKTMEKAKKDYNWN